MKPGLKRIEAMLDQLEVQNDAPVSIMEGSPSLSGGDRNGNEQCSFPATKPKPKIQVEPFPLPKGQAETAPAAVSAVSGSAKEQTEAKLPILPTENAVEPAGAPAPGSSPENSVAQFSSLSANRQAANPNLVIGLLKEIETLVREWQKELEQTVQQIQVVYQDGPIVDGWLESYPPGGQAAPPSASVSMLRHAEIEHLMTFIEQICQVEQAQITEDMRRTSYRLCGLDPDGKVWSRPCPSEQVPYVSLAIARYQKLRTLLTKKQTLENRLTSLVESLTLLHSQIREG